jgi:hypothetical protein
MPTSSRCVKSIKPEATYGIADEIEALKLQIARLPSRDYVSRLTMRATAAI